MRKGWVWGLGWILLGASGVGSGQAPAGQGVADPLAVGVAAMQKGDFASAKTFFTGYLKDSADDPAARFYRAEAEMGLQEFTAAVTDLEAVVARNPGAWPAHLQLVLAYARSENWAAFDKERVVIKAARDANMPGLDKDAGDLIDVLHVGGLTYQVQAFYTLHGTYKTRYVFLHFNEAGKLTDYVQCESDDSDQSFFKQKHPKEAAAGERSFSLDTYSFGEKGSTQGLIKFYSDGEPSYETVRADVLGVLGGRSKPAASTDVPAGKAKL